MYLNKNVAVAQYQKHKKMEGSGMIVNLRDHKPEEDSKNYYEIYNNLEEQIIKTTEKTYYIAMHDKCRVKKVLCVTTKPFTKGLLCTKKHQICKTFNLKDNNYNVFYFWQTEDIFRNK
ncbi:hypothetical protein QTP88_020660 [Uroleucon formosanum]